MEKKTKKSKTAARKVIKLPRKRGPASNFVDNYADLIADMTPDDIQKMAEIAKDILPKMTGAVMPSVIERALAEPPVAYRYIDAANVLDKLTAVAERAQKLDWPDVVEYCAQAAAEIVEPPRSATEVVDSSGEPIELASAPAPVADPTLDLVE